MGTREWTAGASPEGEASRYVGEEELDPDEGEVHQKREEDEPRYRVDEGT